MTDRTQTEPLLEEMDARQPAGGPEWVAGMRRDAAARLRETGFPTRKTENWRFTSVKPVTGTAFRSAPGPAGLRGPETAPAGVTIERLSEVLARDPESIRPHLGKIAVAEHFAALNAAMFDDGLVVRIAPGAVVEEPIHVAHDPAASGGPTAAYPRVLVLAGENSQAHLVETYSGEGGEKHLTNVVTEVNVGPAARLHHTRVQHGGDQEFHVATLAVRQERDSFYGSHVVTLGGALARLDLGVLLDGQGAECTLDGVYHVRGTEHVDHQTYVDHAKPHCTSRESYRGVLDDQGHAVFNGIVVVRRDAQRTAAHQENRNLLLSDDAQINTKPHLEIDADDVTCSHGATIGAIDDQAMFYLRSRGIPEDRARAILTFAFVHALLDTIPDEAVRRSLGRALLSRLPHGDVVKELVG